MRASNWILSVILGWAWTGFGCNGNETGGGAGGASSVGGATSAGGASTAGGATSAGGGSGGNGVESCGSAVCRTGEFCCNRSCNLCAPQGSGCIQMVCPDAGIPGRGCRAVPGQDSICADGGYPPHLYTCDLGLLPAPCVQVYWGDVMQAFCCEA